MNEPQANMNVMDAIYQRRAVRSYTAETLSFEIIHRLLEAAVHAPTAMREEAWAFAVIEDKNLLKRTSDKAKESMKAMEQSIHVPDRHLSSSFIPPENIFYNAAALIVIYAKPMGLFAAADCWLAAENLMLAAYTMKLGTCVIGSAVPILNTVEWKKELGIPDEMTAIAPIIVGIPSGDTPVTSRKEAEILVWK